MEQKKWGKIFFLFLISYAILYIFSIFHTVTGFGNWSVSLDLSRLDYFYVLVPIPGFFLMYFLVGWAEKYFETKFTRTLWFGLLILAFAVVAYYVALFWFFCNLFSMAQVSVCSAEGATQTAAYLSGQTPISNIIVNFFADLPVDFLAQFFGSLLRTEFVKSLLASPYIVFVFGAFFGWASKVLLEKLEG